MYPGRRILLLLRSMFPPQRLPRCKGWPHTSPSQRTATVHQAGGSSDSRWSCAQSFSKGTHMENVCCSNTKIYSSEWMDVIHATCTDALTHHTCGVGFKGVPEAIQWFPLQYHLFNAVAPEDLKIPLHPALVGFGPCPLCTDNFMESLYIWIILYTVMVINKSTKWNVVAN